jgi:DNA ligase (NAD+)
MACAMSLHLLRAWSVNVIIRRSTCTCTAMVLVAPLSLTRSSNRRLSSWAVGHPFPFLAGPSSRATAQSAASTHKKPSAVCFMSSAASSHDTTEEGALSSTVDQKEEQDLQEVYRELKWLSGEIRRHDALYYSNKVATTATSNNQQVLIITDEDYDALTRREEEICRAYPELLAKWENESGLEKEATRAGGRVGIAVDDDDDNETLAGSTKAITAAQPRFQKRSHLTPMLSLENVTTKDQLVAWLERLRKKLLASSAASQPQQHTRSPPLVTILTEPKLDGLSLSLRYKLVTAQDGERKDPLYHYELVWACTRGDGRKGQDVTLPVVEGMKLPTSLPVPSAAKIDNLSPSLLEIRGEVVMPKSIFEALKEEAAKLATEHEQLATDATGSDHTAAPLQRFSNARNAASGILLRKDDVESGSQNSIATRSLQSKLQFYAYDVIADPADQKQQLSWLEDALSSRQQLEAWGFQVPTPVAVTTLAWRTLTQNTTTSSEALPEKAFEPWTNVDIQPMLEYHDAFGRHREEQSARDKSVSQNKVTSCLAWGDYDMDGCVHKVSNKALRDLIGNSNRAPRWAVAHKLPAQSAITSLMGIEIQVGRKTGALTPVAILEPVVLSGGITVTRATLHNFQHMQQMLLGSDRDDSVGVESTQVPCNVESVKASRQHPVFLARGSKVLVRRAGDVIPQVVQLAEPPKLTTGASAGSSLSSWIDLSAPLHCPACGSPTVADLSGSQTRLKSKTATETAAIATTSGQVVRCGGPQLLCPPRAVGALVHAFSRDALDISGLSEARIQQLAMPNITTSAEGSEALQQAKNASLTKLQFPIDLFRLAQDPESVEAMAALPGWGNKSAQNLADTANRVASEGVSLARFIYSLSIRHAGIHSSKIVATAYGSVDAFLQAVDKASADEESEPFEILANKDDEVNKGIGPSLLSALIEFSREKKLVKAAKELADVVKVLDDDDFRKEGSTQSNATYKSENSREMPFFGMKVVFTGSGSLGNVNLTRKEAQALAKSMGAKSTPGSISKATDVVVVGGNGGGKKLQSAKDFGIRILSLDEFMELARDFQKLVR